MEAPRCLRVSASYQDDFCEDSRGVAKQSSRLVGFRPILAIFAPQNRKTMSEKKTESQVIFDRNAVEFVTVAAEFCKFLEGAEGSKRADFVDTSLKILPLLYLKALLLPPCEVLGEEELESYVSEETYEVLRMNLADILAERDDYLDVFVEDMKYSDQPITRYISEDLADIYQDIKDFIFVFQLGYNETMHDALATCQEHFRLYWGQRLVNTLRALHEVKFCQTDETDEEEDI